VMEGKELKRVNLFDSRVLAATMTPDGRGLAVVLLVPGERNDYLWEFTDEESVVPRPKGPLQPRISYDGRQLTISPDARWVDSAGRSSGNKERPVEIHPCVSGKLLDDLKPAQTWSMGNLACGKLAFTHDSRRLLAWGCEEKARMRRSSFWT